MKRVLTAAVLIPVVLLVLFAAPDWLGVVVCALVAALALREYFDIADRMQLRPLRLTSYLLLAIVFAAFLANMWFDDDFGESIQSLVVLTSPFILLAVSMRNSDLRDALPSAASSFLGLAYTVIPMYCLVLLWAMMGAHAVLFVFLCVWVGDALAFYVGRAFGRHKLAPRVSPGKSVEGAVASIVGSVLVAVIVAYTGPSWEQALRNAGQIGWFSFTTPTYAQAIVLAVAINIAAQLGDLMESAMKRGAGVKDSGTLLPGHGGVLDRIDALLFALPVALFFFGIVDKIPF